MPRLSDCYRQLSSDESAPLVRICALSAPLRSQKVEPGTERRDYSDFTPPCTHGTLCRVAQATSLISVATALCAVFPTFFPRIPQESYRNCRRRKRPPVRGVVWSLGFRSSFVIADLSPSTRKGQDLHPVTIANHSLFAPCLWYDVVVDDHRHPRGRRNAVRPQDRRKSRLTAMFKRFAVYDQFHTSPVGQVTCAKTGGFCGPAIHSPANPRTCLVAPGSECPAYSRTPNSDSQFS